MKDSTAAVLDTDSELAGNEVSAAVVASLGWYFLVAAAGTAQPHRRTAIENMFEYHHTAATPRQTLWLQVSGRVAG